MFVTATLLEDVVKAHRCLSEMLSAVSDYIAICAPECSTFYKKASVIFFCLATLELIAAVIQARDLYQRVEIFYIVGKILSSMVLSLMVYSQIRVFWTGILYSIMAHVVYYLT